HKQLNVRGFMGFQVNNIGPGEIIYFRIGQRESGVIAVGDSKFVYEDDIFVFSKDGNKDFVQGYKVGGLLNGLVLIDFLRIGEVKGAEYSAGEIVTVEVPSSS